MSAGPPKFAPFPFILVRCASLARSDLDGIRHCRALALHDEAFRLRDRISDVAADAIKHLHARVPHITERSMRRKALATKRKLFHGNPLSDVDWLDKLAPDPPLAAAIREYVSLQVALAQALAARDADYDANADAQMKALLALLRRREFRLALAMVNRRLAEQLERIDIGGALRKGRRQSLLRAVRYLLRATFRPTPLSFFAANSIAELGLRQSAPAPPTSASSSVQPNRAIYRSIMATMLAHGAVRASAMVFAAPTFFTDGSRHWVADADGERYSEVALASGGAARSAAAAGRGLRDDAFAAATGLTADARDHLVERGVLWIYCDEPESIHDDGATVVRALWQAAPSDLSLLTLIDRLSAFEEALRESASLDPATRMRALATSEEIARTLLDIAADVALPPLAFEDAAASDRVELPPDWSSFADDVVRFGAQALLPTPSPEEETLTHLYALLCPGEPRVAFLEFHRRYGEFCHQHCLEHDPETNALAVCGRLGQSYRDIIAPVVADLEASMAAGASEINFVPSPPPAGSNAVEPPKRLSIRFAPTAPGPAGPRFHLRFWGSDRMSLFPRYARPPDPNAARLRQAFAIWMAQWPEVVDVHASFGRNVDARSAFTSRVIDGFDLPSGPNGIALRELSVRYVAEERRLGLFDAADQRIRPVFLGVSARHRLPGVVRFLLFFCGSRTSALDLTLLAFNRILLTAMRSRPAIPVRIPAVFVGQHTLLSPPTVVVDPRQLPALGPRIGRADFFAFHDWLSRHDLPRLAQVQAPRRRPMYVDFQHPLGIESFLRFARDADGLMLQPIDDNAVAHINSRAHSVEYYAELSTFSQQPAC